MGDAATYGPAGRSTGSPCIPCMQAGKTYGFSFHWEMLNDVFVPRTVSRTGASATVDCLSEYSQLLDSAWWLPLSSTGSTTVTQDVATFADCVALCTPSSMCQFVTYDYVAKDCLVRNAAEVVYEG